MSAIWSIAMCVSSQPVDPSPLPPNSQVRQSKLAQLESLRMNGEEYARVEHLHKLWYGNAVKALLGVLGRELLLNMEQK